MDFTRVKKTLAGLSVVAMALTQAGPVFAAYSDVSPGVWFADAVSAFVDAGYLDAGQARFRGGDSANRAEFVKLVVELNGGILSTPPAVPSFDDVAAGAWYYGYFEEAGKEGWVRGDQNCYGTRPCYARPSAKINRAEAAALIARAFGLESTGAAPQFVDNPSGQWYTDVIQTAADHCVLQGDDSTGRVRPGDFMNRAEMVVMLHRVDQGLSYGVDCGEVSTTEPMLTGATATSSTNVELEFNVALDQASAEDPESYSVANGAELSVVSADLVNPTTVELTLADAQEAGTEYTVSATVMTADGEELADSATFMGYSAFVRGEGTLELSLAAANPVGDTIPKGAVGVVMASIDLTASCDDSVAVENVTILHEGFGDETDISGVYAAINGARVTRKRTIDSEDQTADLRFASPLILDPCETVTVDLVADFTATAATSAEHNMVIELPSDIFSNARSVSGNFPIRGDSFRIAAVTSGIVSIDYRSISPSEVEVGNVAAVIGKFEVSVDSVEDQTFYSMTLEQNSSASDGDFVNVAIRRTDGTILTNTVSQSVGDFVTVVFDPPFTILEGDKITLEVIADIVGGAGDSIILHFEENSDLFAVGSLYGYGVNGQLYGSQVAIPADDASTVNIDAGEFTIGISGPATQDYTRDDNDAVLANLIFQTGGEDIDVKDLFILIQGRSSTGGILCGSGGASAADCGTGGSDDDIHQILEDVEIRNKATGRTIDGVRLTGTTDLGVQTTAASRGRYQIYRFDDFIVRGKETWEFRVDFIDNGSARHPRNGDDFRILVCGEPTHITSGTSLATNTTGCSFSSIITSSTAYQMQVEGLSTGDKVGDVRPRGSIAGNFHRIAAATLTIAVKNIGTTDTSVSNAKNVNFLRFEARAGEAEDILYTKSVFESASGSLNNGQNYSLWVDTDGDGKVDTILEDGVASQSSQITFADMAGGGYVIPAEETVLFEVHADIASSLTNNDLQLRFATGSTVTYIEAEELDDGSALSGLRLNNTCSTTCDIIVTTTASQVWILVTQGDLFVTKDTAPLRNRQLLGGALGEAILRIQLHAENESIDVTDLQFNSSGSTVISLDRLELFKEGETTPFALATIGGCGNDDVLTIWKGSSTRAFCANMENRQLVVAEGADLDVIVRPRMKTDVGGATSNDTIQFFVTPQAVSNESSGSGAVRARGDESSNNLIANNGNTAANGEVFIGLTAPASGNGLISGVQNQSVLAKVTSITNANPDPNGTAVPTGRSDIGQFKFSAAAHGNSKDGLNDWVLSGVVFNVNATNLLISSGTWLLFNKADATITHTCTPRTLSNGAVRIYSGSYFVHCLDLITDDAANGRGLVNTEIDQGTDATFVLQANVTNPQVAANSTSTLQISLQNFDQLSRITFATTDASTASHISWQDLDGDSTNPFFTWIEYPDTTVKSTSYQS